MPSIFDEKLSQESEPEANMLAGLPDFTYGQATKFISELSVEDREITHWYLLQGLRPFNATKYTKDLVGGYAVVDPERTIEGGKEAAHFELARVNDF